jgi:hypothetical protein
MMGRFLLVLVVASLAVPLGSCSDSTTNGSETPTDIVRKVQLAPAAEAAVKVKKGDPLATFVFSQFEDETIHLAIENIVSSDGVNSISFAFDVSFQPKVVSPTTPPWSNQGAVTDLERGQIADAGIIAVSPTPISMGEITIEILNNRISYK